MSLLLTLNRLYISPWFFHYWLRNYWLGIFYLVTGLSFIRCSERLLVRLLLYLQLIIYVPITDITLVSPSYLFHESNVLYETKYTIVDNASADHITSNLLKAVHKFHKFYLVHSWILCAILFVSYITPCYFRI